MSSDDTSRNRESETIQLDVDDVDTDDVPDFPNFPDHEEFVKTQEMDSLKRTHTDPLLTSLETTQRYDVPDDLLQMAMRSQEMEILRREPDQEWREFVAVVDPRGRIVLPSRVQADLRGKKLRVKYVVEGKS